MKCPAKIRGMVTALKEIYKDHLVCINKSYRTYRKEDPCKLSYELSICNSFHSTVCQDGLTLKQLKALVEKHLNK